MKSNPVFRGDKYREKTKDELISDVEALHERVSRLLEAGAALHEGEARLKAMIDGSQIPQFAIDPDHKVIYWNKAVEKYSGLRASDILGTDQHWKAFYGEKKPCMVDFLVEGREEDIPLFYPDNCKKSGLVDGAYEGFDFFPILGERGTWLHYTAKAIRDDRGNIIGAMETLEDITERKKAEDALRESERLFRAIFDQTFQLMGILTVDGTLIEANRAALEFIGAEGSDVVGKPFWDTPWWSHSRELQEKLRAAIKKSANGEFVRFESTHPAKDGILHYIDFSIKPVVDESGRVVLLIPEGREISERKRAEEALGDAKNQAELYVDLMGHDINNLNHAIMGYLELAIDTIGLDEGEKELLSRPLELVANSSALISNVKKLKRLKAGECRQGVKDAGQAIEEARSMHMNVPSRDVAINYAPVDGCLVLADESLKDVFSNLIENSIKHSRGPLTVDIALSAVRAGDKKYYRISVEDDGPGMSDDLKTTVLDRFCLVKLGATGRGMGLCLTKALVDSYQGKISVEDRVPGDHKKGCRFVVLLQAF